MSVAKAVALLRQSVDLCNGAMDGESDRQIIEGLTFVRAQLEIVIAQLESYRPAIPLRE